VAGGGTRTGDDAVAASCAKYARAHASAEAPCELGQVMVQGKLITISGAGGASAEPGSESRSGAAGAAASGQPVRDYAFFFDDCLGLAELGAPPSRCLPAFLSFFECFDDAIYVCVQEAWRTYDCGSQNTAVERCLAQDP